jgi:hypothetical protein
MPIDAPSAMAVAHSSKRSSWWYRIVQPNAVALTAVNTIHIQKGRVTEVSAVKVEVIVSFTVLIESLFCFQSVLCSFGFGVGALLLVHHVRRATRGKQTLTVLSVRTSGKVLRVVDGNLRHGL